MLNKIEQQIENWKIHQYKDEILESFSLPKYLIIVDRLLSERNDSYNQFSSLPHGKPHSETVVLPLVIKEAIVLRYTVTVYDSGLILKSCYFWDTVAETEACWNWEVIEGDVHMRQKRKKK